MEKPQHQISNILELVHRTETLRIDIELAIKAVPDEMALTIVEEESFTGFNPDGFALFDFRLVDKALKEKVRVLFIQYPRLLYVTLGYCTDPSESASATGINHLVFGFFPAEHQGAHTDSIRNFLLGEARNLSSRERLVFEANPIEIPTFSTRFPADLEEFEEGVRDLPDGFPETVKDLEKLAEMWFEAYDKYYQDETDCLVRYWRDGARMSRNVWADDWFQTN
jgi:hypothetical protein